MEVLEIKKEEKDMKKENSFTTEEALVLGRSVFELLNSCPSLSGKLFYALGKNEQKLEKIASDYRKNQAELLKKHGFMKEDFSFEMKKEEDVVPNGNPFLFKSEDDEQKYEVKCKEVLESLVFLDLHKVEKSLFEDLDINPTSNRNFIFLVDNLSF